MNTFLKAVLQEMGKQRMRPLMKAAVVMLLVLTLAARHGHNVDKYMMLCLWVLFYGLVVEFAFFIGKDTE